MNSILIKKISVFALVLIVLAAASFAPGETIKIMSANLTSGNYQAYESPGIRIFQALKPDIVMINEFQYKSGTLRDLVNTAFGEEYHYYCEPTEDTGDIPNGVVSRWTIMTSGEWNDGSMNRDFAWATIDIPGEKNLHAVSVHLKYKDDSQQGSEATTIKNQIQANFPSDDYIVVGGDMNIRIGYTRALNVFNEFLSPETHIPVDGFAPWPKTRYTSEERDDPYDWVMPNAELDKYHTTLYVGTNFRAFTEGIVFDSHYYIPLSEVSPVQYPDSHVSGMQHMAVMKAFNIPASCPEGPILEGFDNFNTGLRPGCWTFNNCNSNSDTYTTTGNYGESSPSIKLDETGDSVTSRLFTADTDFVLTFWLKGESVAPISSLLVEEYTSDWATLTELFGNPSSAGVVGPYELDNLSEQVRFSYTDNGGDLALDDVRIDLIASPTPPTPTLTPTPTASVTPTSTPPPTATPTPSIIPTSTPTPSSSPSPSPPAGLPWIHDYNGDGTSDIAVFRASSGLWSVRGITRIYFGGADDATVPADYSGNGTTDFGIFRETSGLWAIRGTTRAYFGSGSDLPQPGDYDGDGTAEIGIFRDTSGLWAIRGLTRVYFGADGDEALPGYYDADGTADIALFRGSSQLWALRSISRLYFGRSGDDLVPGDYNGTGFWAPGVFRPASGLWAIRAITRLYFGNATDSTVPAAYSGGVDLPAVFRPSSGLWAVEGATRVYYGTSGDLPVTR